jgi:DNA polymerase I-like protein with 3'-5' exonuclease and polymerase domains
MQHVSGRIRGGIEYTSAANGFFQGLLADACKSALRRISRECYVRNVRVPDRRWPNSKRSQFTDMNSPLFGSRPILFAHDEILLEHPESVAAEGAMRVSEIMVDELRYYCPDLADACAAEPTLMRRWLKQAKKTKDANGRLIPWEPPARQAA